jgi:hypothetical protein
MAAAVRFARARAAKQAVGNRVKPATTHKKACFQSELLTRSRQSIRGRGNLGNLVVCEAKSSGMEKPQFFSQCRRLVAALCQQQL